MRSGSLYEIIIIKLYHWIQSKGERKKSSLYQNTKCIDFFTFVKYEESE